MSAAAKRPWNYYAFAAEEDALRHYLATLPSAADVAASIPGWMSSAIADAGYRNGGLMVPTDVPAQLKELRAYGLVDYPSAISNGRMLSNFGVQVRRVLLAEV